MRAFGATLTAWRTSNALWHMGFGAVLGQHVRHVLGSFELDDPTKTPNYQGFRLSGEESACRRGSVPGPLSRFRSVTIHLSGLPGRVHLRGGERRTADVFRFGLAPSGVYLAIRVTPNAGALLPHRFTLTCAPNRSQEPSAVCFLWHFPADRSDWPLASTLSCGAPTFLDQSELWTRSPG